jgi:Tfp pilus assembly protein PilO
MNGVFVLIPIMVLGIAVAGIVSSSVLKLQRLRLEEARLRTGEPSDISDLADRISALQDQLTEVQERLDFAERMLTQVRGAPSLPGPPPTHEPPTQSADGGV